MKKIKQKKQQSHHYTCPPAMARRISKEKIESIIKNLAREELGELDNSDSMQSIKLMKKKFESMQVSFQACFIQDIDKFKEYILYKRNFI